MKSYQPRKSSALGGYIPTPPTLLKKDPRLIYMVMMDRVKILNEVAPYLDCEVKCGCDKYYHHLRFKKKSENKYICPADKCGGLNLKDGIRVR